MRLYRATRLNPKTGEREEYGSWLVSFRDANGTLQRRATGIRERALALIKAAEIARRVERVKAGLETECEAGALTFRDAIPQYLEFAETRKKASTFASDKRRFDVIRPASWAALRLCRVTPADLTRWADQRTKAGASGATVNRDLCLISALFTWAVRLGHTRENPVKRVQKFSEKGRAREVYLSAEESRALLSVASPPIRPILTLALSTGMRRGEILSLEWRDLDFTRREILVRPENEKAGRGRVIPMTEDLIAEFVRLRSGGRVIPIKGTACVFPIRAENLRRHFESAVERCAAIPLDKRGKVTFHTLRHTAASLMVGEGVPLFDVAKILGHSTIAVTMRYSHFAPRAGRAAVDALGSALALAGGATEAKAATGTEGKAAPVMGDSGLPATREVLPVLSPVLSQEDNTSVSESLRETRKGAEQEQAAASNSNGSDALRPREAG